MKDVAIFDVDVLAAPWLTARELKAKVRALAEADVVPVALLPTDLWQRTRRSKKWHGPIHNIAHVQVDAKAETFDERLAAVGPWIEQWLGATRPPTRVVIVSISEAHALLAGVSWAAEARADGWKVGLRHVLWDLGRPAAGMAHEVRRALDAAGQDLVATRGW